MEFYIPELFVCTYIEWICINNTRENVYACSLSVGDPKIPYILTAYLHMNL